jgi:hypothetical protein
MARSLTWLGAFEGEDPIGFVNVAWDSGVHAFLLDTRVREDRRHLGIGTRLVAEAVAASRNAAPSLEWPHVDFDDHLQPFYMDACGFVPTKAGLVRMATEDRLGTDSR